MYANSLAPFPGFNILTISMNVRVTEELLYRSQGRVQAEDDDWYKSRNKMTLSHYYSNTNSSPALEHRINMLTVEMKVIQVMECFTFML